MHPNLILWCTLLRDSTSVVGQDTTAPSHRGYGGIIWATDAEQEKHESFVLVPGKYPDVVLDDHDGYTAVIIWRRPRPSESVESSYNVDQDRIYATESMGCMIFMYLAAEHPICLRRTVARRAVGHCAAVGTGEPEIFLFCSRRR